MLRWQIRLPVVLALLIGVFFTVSIVKARLGALPIDLREIPLLNVEIRVADLGKVRFGSRTDIAFRIENLGLSAMQNLRDPDFLTLQILLWTIIR